MQIRRFRRSDAKVVSRLARQVFDEHVALTFKPVGIAEMHTHLRAEAIAQRARTHLTLVALMPEPDTPSDAPTPSNALPGERPTTACLVGVIELRNAERVSMLFVSTPHMGQGIATELMARAEAASRAAGSVRMTVHSSLNAVGFYHKLGFVPVAAERKVYGFAYVPMERLLQ
jgi:GNAT superfamily N-acetyltransferase